MWRSWSLLLIVGACVQGGTDHLVPPDPDPDPPPSPLANCDGAFDATFGAAGILVADNHVPLMEPLAAAMQPDDKLVVVGRAFVDTDRFVLVRYLPDGTLDPAFGNGGLSVPAIGEDARPRAVVVDENGNLVVAGTLGTQSVLARFTPDGAPDASFGGGVVMLGTDVPYGVAVTAAGITVATDAGLGRARLYRRDAATGAADATFGDGGSSLLAVSQPNDGSVVSGFSIDANGRHLLAGRDGRDGQAISARADASGEIDATFGIGGRAFPTENVSGFVGIVEQIPGRAVAILDRSRSSSVTVLYGHIEFGAPGSSAVDPAYGGGGVSRMPSGLVATSYAMAAEDALVIGGDNEGYWVAGRTTANGTFDRCWSTEAPIGTSRIMTVDSQQRIVMVGAAPEDDGTERTRLVLARLAP